MILSLQWKHTHSREATFSKTKTANQYKVAKHYEPMNTQSRKRLKGSCARKSECKSRNWFPLLLVSGASFLRELLQKHCHLTFLTTSKIDIRLCDNLRRLRLSQKRGSLTSSGQPNMEKGNRPEENQVSKTSSSAKKPKYTG